MSFPVAVFISLLSWGLLIPVDEGGLATFKNHFFHTLNSLSVVLSMLIVPKVIFLSGWLRRKFHMVFSTGMVQIPMSPASTVWPGIPGTPNRPSSFRCLLLIQRLLLVP